MNISVLALTAWLGFLITSPAGSQEAAATGKLPFEGTETFGTLVARLDLSVILRSWRILGVRTCPCPPRGITACVEFENAWPVGILEVVRSAGRTHILEMAPAFAAFGLTGLGGLTSSHSPSAADGTALQFAEAHVFGFTPEIPIVAEALPLVVPPPIPYAPAFLSEIDGFFWRSGLAEWLLEPRAMAAATLLGGCIVASSPDRCAGSWGPYIPRIGFGVNPSEVISSFLQGLRAGRVAANPTGRFVVGTYPWEPRTGHYVQMIRPLLRNAVPIGFPVIQPLEAGALSPRGAYLLVHYGLFRECKGCWGPKLSDAKLPLF